MTSTTSFSSSSLDASLAISGWLELELAVFVEVEDADEDDADEIQPGEPGAKEGEGGEGSSSDDEDEGAGERTYLLPTVRFIVRYIDALLE